MASRGLWNHYNVLQLISSSQFSVVDLIQATDSRDSLAMALYAQCFSWLVGKINARVRGKENFKSVGILDIFGFENFQVWYNFS